MKIEKIFFSVLTIIICVSSIVVNCIVIVRAINIEDYLTVFVFIVFTIMFVELGIVTIYGILGDNDV